MVTQRAVGLSAAPGPHADPQNRVRILRCRGSAVDKLPEGWSWMADTTVTHQPATESTDRTPISEIGGHLAESRGAILKGARGLTFGQTRNGSEEGGSARVRERLEARGPRRP
ncbi:unnamed protein product [Boreogadus saida]